MNMTAENFMFYFPLAVSVICLILLYPVFKKIAVYYYNVYFNKKPFVITYYDEDGNKTEHYVFYPKSKVFMFDQMVQNTLTPLDQLSKKKGVKFTLTPYEPIEPKQA